MIRRFFLSIPLLLLLTSSAAPQIRSDDGVSLEERARRIEPFINESSRRYGVDARILKILCFIESRYRLDAVSPKGARGPMQFMPETAKRFGLKNPHDARAAIDAAAHYLCDLLRKFGGRLDLALAAYNAGEGTVQSFLTGKPLVLASGKVINRRGQVTGGMPPYRETQKYVKSAIALYVNSELIRGSRSDFLTRSKTSASRENSGSVSLDARDQGKRSSLAPTLKDRSFFIEVQ